MLFPYKDENPTERFPVVTIFLIVANCVVFFHQISLPPDAGEMFVMKMGMIPYEVLNLDDRYPPSPMPVVFTVFTSMFLHGSLFHLFGNMLFLWIFGNNIEDRTGHFGFLVFYIFCGTVGSLVHAFSSPSSLTPCVGASGAISGTMGAYVLLYPKARIRSLLFFIIIIRIIRLPAYLYLGVWIFIQVMNGMSSLEAGVEGGVAWFAHIGGFVVGTLIALFIIITKGRPEQPGPYYPRRYRRL